MYRGTENSEKDIGNCQTKKEEETDTISNWLTTLSHFTSMALNFKGIGRVL